MLHHNISHYKISVIISNGTLGVPLGYDENQTDNSKNVLKYTQTYDHWHTVYVHDHHRQARYYRRASRTKFRILPPTPPLARHFIVQQATTHHHRRRESGFDFGRVFLVAVATVRAAARLRVVVVLSRRHFCFASFARAAHRHPLFSYPSSYFRAVIFCFASKRTAVRHRRRRVCRSLRNVFRLFPIITYNPDRPRG